MAIKCVKQTREECKQTLIIYNLWVNVIQIPLSQSTNNYIIKNFLSLISWGFETIQLFSQ